MKRIISLLMICMIITTSAGFALELEGGSEAERLAADQMVKLSIFRGDGNALNLDENLKREELMLLIARLQGQELQALTYNKRPHFVDIEDPWWEPVMAWAYASQLTKGTSETTFGFGDPVELYQMELFLLRVLGEDPAVSDAHALAVDRGLLRGVEEQTYVSRGTAAIMMKNALEAVPAGESVSLRLLLGLGDLISTDQPLAILSVMQTGEKELTLELNGPAEGKAVAMTRRDMDVAVEAIDAVGNELVVTTALPLFETKYQIQVDEASASFMPGQQAEPARLEILTESFTRVAYETDQIVVAYRLLDQYGKEITEESVLSQIAWQARPSASVEDNEEGRLVISNAGDWEWKDGETVIVLQGFLQLEESALVVTSQGLIEPVAGAEQIALGELENLLGDQTAFMQDTQEDDDHYYALPVYVGGDSPVMAKYVAGEDGILNTEDDGLLLSVQTDGLGQAEWALHPDDEDLAVIHVTAAGHPEEETLRVTLVDRYSGAYDYREVTIDKVSTLETFVFFAPDDLIKVGDLVALPFEAYDQYGMRMMDYQSLIMGVELDPGMPTLRFQEDETTQAVDLIYRPTQAGTQILTATANGKTQRLEVEVYEESRPVRIGGFTPGVRTWMTDKAEITLSRNSFIIYDQYNEPVDLSDGYRMDIMEADESQDAVTASADSLSGQSTVTFARDGSFGSKDYQARIAGEGYKAFAFTMNSVDVGDLDGFAMAPLGLLYDYSRQLPLSDAYPREEADYLRLVHVYGQYGGHQVQLWTDASDAQSDVRAYSLAGPAELVILGAHAFVRAEALDRPGSMETARVFATINAGPYTEEVAGTAMVMDTSSAPAAISLEKDPNQALKRGEHFDADSNVLEIKLDHFAEWDGLDVYRNSEDRIDVLYFQVADQYGVVSQFDPARYALLYDHVEDPNAVAIGASSGVLSIDEARLHRGDRFRIRATADNGQSIELTIVLR